jgi:SAM-dependent methyltransferase
MRSDSRHAPAQDWSSDAYAANARFVSDLAGDVVGLLAARPGERILDLGCGDGVLSQQIAAHGATVVAVDASPEFVEAARTCGLDARIANGHHLAFVEEFDAVFSNAALHWMRDSRAVIAGVFRALRPGGRFVAECGGEGNVATLIAAIDRVLGRRGKPGLTGNPWTFAGAVPYGQWLTEAGFDVRSIGLHPRPTRLPGDVGGWLDTFAAAFLGVLPAVERAAARDEIVEELRPLIRDAEGVWWADYVRLRFVAVKR